MGNKLCTDETEYKGNEFAVLCFLGCSLKDCKQILLLQFC